MYGKLGILAYDEIEGKIQCHVCGRWFFYLFPHLRWKHELTLDEYREDYGLNRTQPLCSPILSEKHRKTFIDNGLVGKHLDFNLCRFCPTTERRLQGRLNFSKARTGVSLIVTPKRKSAQRRNYRNSLVPMPCVECGTMVLFRVKQGKNPVCSECRPLRKKKMYKLWADANRQHLREYWWNYDRNRRVAQTNS